MSPCEWVKVIRWSFETGLYNLTQDEAPVLVHLGAEDVENWLLVRMEEPEEDQE